MVRWACCLYPSFLELQLAKMLEAGAVDLGSSDTFLKIWPIKVPCLSGPIPLAFLLSGEDFCRQNACTLSTSRFPWACRRAGPHCSQSRSRFLQFLPAKEWESVMYAELKRLFLSEMLRRAN